MPHLGESELQSPAYVPVGVSERSRAESDRNLNGFLLSKDFQEHLGSGRMAADALGEPGGLIMHVDRATVDCQYDVTVEKSGGGGGGVREDLDDENSGPPLDQFQVQDELLAYAQERALLAEPGPRKDSIHDGSDGQTDVVVVGVGKGGGQERDDFGSIRGEGLGAAVSDGPVGVAEALDEQVDSLELIGADGVAAGRRRSIYGGGRVRGRSGTDEQQNQKRDEAEHRYSILRKWVGRVTRERGRRGMRGREQARTIGGEVREIRSWCCCGPAAEENEG